MSTLQWDMDGKPRVLRRETIARTRVFQIEELELQFSNGTTVRYERLLGSPRGAVMVVPLLDEDTVLLVREYAAGMDRYELALPKGLIEEGETPVQSANREMMEEVGFAARRLDYLGSMSLAPAYQCFVTHVVLATELYERRLPGDEPEEIEVVPWRLTRLSELIARDDFTEARSMAALFLVRDRCHSILGVDHGRK